MILLCGIPSEPPLRLVAEAAERCGAKHVVLNQRESHFSDILLEVRGGSVGGSLWIGDTEIPFGEISGIYVRLTEWETLPENRVRGRAMPDPRLLEKSRRFHEILQEWIEVAECRVMNRSFPSASNMSKPYQAQWIREAGFRVPETLVTNDPDAVRDFRRRHGRVVFKSISSIRSIVRELDARYEQRLDKIRYLPAQFQALVEGTDVRVHVAGERVFATEIRSGAVDYRYAERDGEDVEMTPVDLPADVAAKCRDLSRSLDLPLCGIDLRRDASGKFYCFEVNPSPAFSYYQQYTEQPIAGAIVEYLAGRAC